MLVLRLKTLQLLISKQSNAILNVHGCVCVHTRTLCIYTDVHLDT